TMTFSVRGFLSPACAGTTRISTTSQGIRRIDKSNAKKYGQKNETQRKSALCISFFCPHVFARLQFAGLRLRITVGDGFPVDDAPPRVEIIRTLVLILQVIRVLPDIDAHDRRLPLHVRTVLIGARKNLELAIRQNEPGPAAAEALDAGVFDLRF